MSGSPPVLASPPPCKSGCSGDSLSEEYSVRLVKGVRIFIVCLTAYYDDVCTSNCASVNQREKGVF